MTYQDTLVRRYDDPAFRTAFRAYFAELGCQVSNWDGLFQGLEERGDCTWIRRDSQGQIIGFIMFCMTTMQSWFFEARYGFVTEFWVAPEYRGRGAWHGAAAKGGGQLRAGGLPAMPPDQRHGSGVL